MKRIYRPVRRVDLQVSVFTALAVLCSALCVYGCCYWVTYRDMIRSLTDRVYAIHSYLENELSASSFLDINTRADINNPTYMEVKELLETVRNTTGVMYLYTAKQANDGSLVYVVDGLSMEEDFRYPGDAIEPEIAGDLRRALAGEDVLPQSIKDTAWGKIFITYLPVHSGQEIVGVLGIEFEAAHQFNTYRMLRWFTPIIILLFSALSVAFAVLFFRRISNPTYQDMANTDQLTQLKNRNAFEVDLANLSHRNAQIGIIVIDLDNLKQVNDYHGHEAGDHYLCCAAQALDTLRAPNVALYRTGGDEFAVLMENVQPCDLEQAGNSLLEAFSAVRPSVETKTSLSVGWAIFDAARDADLYAVYRRADKNMYTHKKKQRMR